MQPSVQPSHDAHFRFSILTNPTSYPSHSPSLFLDDGIRGGKYILSVNPNNTVMGFLIYVTLYTILFYFFVVFLSLIIFVLA